MTDVPDWIAAGIGAGGPDRAEAAWRRGLVEAPAAPGRPTPSVPGNGTGPAAIVRVPSAGRGAR